MDSWHFQVHFHEHFAICRFIFMNSWKIRFIIMDSLDWHNHDHTFIQFIGLVPLLVLQVSLEDEEDNENIGFVRWEPVSRKQRLPHP